MSKEEFKPRRNIKERYDYWSQLKTQAENGMNDKDNYMMADFGRVKMTEVNKLRNMLHHKLNQNKDDE